MKSSPSMYKKHIEFSMIYMYAFFASYLIGKKKMLRTYYVIFHFIKNIPVYIYIFIYSEEILCCSILFVFFCWLHGLHQI